MAAIISKLYIFYFIWTITLSRYCNVHRALTLSDISLSRYYYFTNAADLTTGTQNKLHNTSSVYLLNKSDAIIQRV